MSVNVRSTVLGALSITDTTQHILLTVPASTTYIVKDIRLNNGSATAGLAQVWIQRGGAPFVYLFNATINAGATAGLTAWAVIQPGDSFRCTMAVQPMNIWVSGTRLTGVAVYP